MLAQQVTDPIAFHGEGPVWSTQWSEQWTEEGGGPRWVDMLAGDVLSLSGDAEDTVTRHHVGSVAAAVRPRRGGGAVLGVDRGFALEGADGSITTLSPVWASTAVRMNDRACDPDGRIEVVLDGVTTSNGLDWSPDGSLAYYNDTPTGQVSVFDYDTETGALFVAEVGVRGLATRPFAG